MKRKAHPPKRREESGFALLLVFVLAAVIAISLFFEMPRVAFESQRMREQMAIDRGLQYQRAIQLFYRKFHTYPTTLDDLETTRNIRFLRRRYLDPMNGKAWRLVHVGPGGILTDSNIKQTNPAQPGRNQAAGASQPGSSPFGSSSFGSGSPTSNPTASNDPNAAGGFDANGQPVNPGLNMAARRPSDRVIGGGTEQPVPEDPNQQAQNQSQNPPQYPAFPQQPGQQPGQDPSQTGQPPQQYPGQAPTIPGLPQFPGQPGQPQNPAQTGQPQDPSQPQQPQYPTQPLGFPGVPPAFSNQPFNPGQPAQTSTGQPAFPGQPGALGAQPNGAAAGGQQQGSAVNMIQQLLTTPRQPPSSTTGSVTTGGVGIAGVGGVIDGKGIHVIKDHSKYKEWEFIYDIKNDKTVVGAAAASQQQQLQNNPNAFQANPLGATSPTSTSPTQAPAAPAPSSPAPTSN